MVRIPVADLKALSPEKVPVNAVEEKATIHADRALERFSEPRDWMHSRLHGSLFSWPRNSLHSRTAMAAQPESSLKARRGKRSQAKQFKALRVVLNGVAYFLLALGGLDLCQPARSQVRVAL